MITKLDNLDIVNREIIVSKINELVDEHNKLAEFFENHYHTTADSYSTNHNSTGPKDGGPSGN